jgi:membrane-associated phospholipid phosphatase
VKTLLKHNWLILSVYFLAILISAFFLLQVGKVQIHIAINSITGNAVFDMFFKYFTHFGDGIVAVIVVAIVLLLNARKGCVVLLAWAMSGLITSLVKMYMSATFRPHFVFGYFVKEVKLHYIEGVDMLSRNSFPSGHATSAFAVFFSVALVTENKFLKFFFFLTAMLAAFSRTYLSQHWLVDITVGSLIGTLSAILFYFVFMDESKLQKWNRPILKVFNP